MNLTINPFNNIYSNNTKNYKTNPTEENVNFTGGKRVILTKPKFESQSIQNFSDRIRNLITSLPDLAKRTKPVAIELNGKIMNVLVDKTNKFGTKVSIESSKLGNDDMMSLELLVNENGQVFRGEYRQSDPFNISFNRSDRNLRRIQYAKSNYMPSTEYENVWQRIKPHSFDYYFYSSQENMVFDRNDLQVFFMELAKRDTSFFAE